LGSIPAANQSTFVANVASNVSDWGVDGIDFDYEPPMGYPDNMWTETIHQRVP
jgi:GH18 family chitinase